ncbi:hypothetical protein FRC06_010029 [Ceratobasidium sp. 370]|nr:hypothetical protein FRC06_010029 [Ceratobasidium sp. 370]
MNYITKKLRRLSLTDNTPRPQAIGPSQVGELTPPAELHQPTKDQMGATGPIQQDFSHKSVVILLLGRSGSGKTFFVETTCSKRGRVDGASITRTVDVNSRNITFSKKRFKLIDTPGFDSLALSNLEAFAKLGDYLLHSGRIRVGIAGVIYIHRAGDPLESRALAQNVDVLSEVFLGDSGLPRLTIMVVPGGSGAHKSASAREVSRHDIFRTAQRKGAKIVEAPLDQRHMDDILISYTSQPPVLLRVQLEGIRDPQVPIVTRIQERLGYHDADSVKLCVDEQVRLQLASYTEQIRSLEAALKEKESEALESSGAHEQTKQKLAKYQAEIQELRQTLRQGRNEYDTLVSQLQLHEGHAEELRSLQETLKRTESQLADCSRAYKQTKRQLATSQEESVRLRQQLQRIQGEYGSLRSQLQLQENTEQSSIVQTLKDLNREVDDIGRLVSEYLSDNYVQKVFGKEPSVVTALDAHHLPELKTLLGHINGRPSLVAASNDVGMPVEDFLDYAIRTLFCKHLCGRIFSPFHPAVDSSKNDVVAAMYDDVQQREPQAVAAKWRANCFKSIFKPEGPDAVAQHVGLIVREFVDRNLTPLLTYFFGQASGVRLDHQHLDRLIRLFRMAWDWNSTLKGEVIILGDFYPTYYAPMHRFDPSLMSEFESDPRKPQPKFILGTLGLGLLSSRAVGGGKSPEVTSWHMSIFNESVNAVPKPLHGAWEGESKIVVGIDIGTTQSGVAFAFLQKGVEQAIHRVTRWPGQEAQNQQSKIPTLVWYDVDNKVACTFYEPGQLTTLVSLQAVSFGAEALSHKVKEEAEDNDWQLAKHFKLHLHPDDMKAKHDLKLDALPYGVPLQQIYSDFLGYLLEHTRTFFEGRVVDGSLIWGNYRSKMEFVIAHPNGWGIREQTFLRAAAIDAGFVPASSPHKIRFVTEAEASVHFCIHHTNLGARLQAGMKFAVCDAGGSTVDTTIYSVIAGRPMLKLEEDRASACVQAGAIFVDAAAEKYFQTVLRNISLSREDIQDYTARGVKDFEKVSKRNFRDETEDCVVEIAGPRFSNSSIRARRGRMTIPGPIVKSFFDVCLDEITASVDQQTEEISPSVCGTIDIQV